MSSNSESKKYLTNADTLNIPSHQFPVGLSVNCLGLWDDDGEFRSKSFGRIVAQTYGRDDTAFGWISNPATQVQPSYLVLVERSHYSSDNPTIQAETDDRLILRKITEDDLQVDLSNFTLRHVQSSSSDLNT